MNDITEEQRRLAAAIREACIEAAKDGYERAAISGLCEDGALEAALSAIHMLDLDAAIQRAQERSP